VTKRALCERIAEDESGVFDAGFKLVAAAATGIELNVIQLALNCTFGQTPGAIPERTTAKGRPPTQYKAASVHPLERTHGAPRFRRTQRTKFAP